MPLEDKTDTLKSILNEIENTGNILTTNPIGTSKGLYVQFLQNPYDDYYVRDSNDIQIGGFTKSMGKPIIFPSCFAIKPGSHKKGWLYRRNIDFMHLIFCKVCPKTGTNYANVGWASLKCIKHYHVWDLPDRVDLSFLETKIWNPLVFNHFKTAILKKEEIVEKREELCLDGRLKNIRGTEWKNLRNGTQDYNDLFESLIIEMKEFVKKFESEDLKDCEEKMSEEKKNRIIQKYTTG